MSKRLALILTAVLLVGSGPREEPVESQELRLFGTWRILGYEEQGGNLTKPAAPYIAEFTGSRLVVRNGAASAGEYFLHFHEGTALPTLDLYRLAGGKKTEPPTPGIYRLEGQLLKIYWGQQREHPKDFRIGNGFATRATVMQRVAE